MTRITACALYAGGIVLQKYTNRSTTSVLTATIKQQTFTATSKIKQGTSVHSSVLIAMKELNQMQLSELTIGDKKYLLKGADTEFTNKILSAFRIPRFKDYAPAN